MVCEESSERGFVTDALRVSQLREISRGRETGRPLPVFYRHTCAASLSGAGLTEPQYAQLLQKVGRKSNAHLVEVRSQE